MRRMITILLVLAILLMGGCVDTHDALQSQPTEVERAESPAGTSLREIEWLDEPFDLSAWLDQNSAYDSAMDMYTGTFVTVKHDESLQHAVAALAMKYPLQDDDQVEQYIRELHNILLDTEYLSPAPVTEGDIAPSVANCYSDGVLCIYYFLSGPEAMYQLDGVFPRVFVSMTDGSILFIAYT